MKISDVLWIAANEFLSTIDGVELVDGHSRSKYSCCAVEHFCKKLVCSSKISWNSVLNPYIKTRGFLYELGVDTGGCFEFFEFEPGEKRQGARYLWLMFAYEVALSEGV